MAKKRRRKDKKTKGFKYKKRSTENWQKRADQSGFSRRSMFDENVTVFRPHDDDNLVRILPPTWEDAEHYGYEIFVHYGIGADRDSILCPSKMKDEPCPICEERSRALSDNDKDYADKLTPRKRVCAYVVDRDNEKEELELWSMPWSMDADITTLAVDKRTGEVLDIDNPEDGYDVEFTKTGKGIKTQYGGIAIARKSSDLGNEEVLEEAIEMPIPDTLVFLEYDDIDKIFNAGAGLNEPDDEDDDDDDDGDDDRPKKKKKKGKKKAKKKPELPTWNAVQEMDLDELEELIEDHDLDVSSDIDEDDEEEIEDLRNDVCEELDLEKPKKRKAKKKEKDKIRKRGKRRR